MAERVQCLYRVSTTKQVDHDDQNQADIPVQRKGLLRIRTTTKWPFRSLKRALSNYWDTSLWGVPIILGRKNLRTDLLFFSHNMLTKEERTGYNRE